MEKKAIILFSIFLFVLSFSKGFSQQKDCDMDINMDLSSLMQEILQFDNEIDWKYNYNLLVSYNDKAEDLIVLGCQYDYKQASENKAFLNFFIGIVFHSVDLFGKSSKYLYQAHSLSQYLNPKQQAYLYLTIGDIEKVNSNYITAMFFFRKSLEVSKKNTIINGEYMATREIGVIYRDLGDYEFATRFLLKAQEILQKIPYESVDKFWLDIHLGRLFRLKKEWKKSIQYYSRAEVNPVCDNSFFKLEIYNELGQYYKNTKSIDSAFLYLNKSIALRSKDQINKGFTSISTHINYGDLLLLKNDTVKAIYHYSNAFKQSQLLGTYKNARRSAIQILKIAKDKSELKNEVLSFITDSYEDEEEFIINSNRFAIQLDELEEKKQEFKKEQEKINDITKLLFVLIPVIVLLNFVLFYVFKQVKKLKRGRIKLKVLNKKMKDSNADLTILNNKLNQFSSFIAHDIKSSIVSVQFGVGILKADAEAKSSLEIILNTLHNEVKKLYSFVDFLLSSAKTNADVNINFTKIKIDSLLKEVNGNFDEDIKALEPKVFWENKSPSFRGNKIQISQLFQLLLVKLITLNHGDISPEIEIKVTKINSNLKVVLIDKGVQVSKEKYVTLLDLFEQSKNQYSENAIGLNICKNIIEQYKGKLWIDTDYLGEGVSLCFELNELIHKKSKTMLTVNKNNVS